MNNTSSFLSNILMNGIQEILIVLKVKENNDFCYEFINQTALEKTNLTATDIGKSVYNVKAGGNWRYYISNHKKVLQTKTMMTFEDAYYSPQGKLYYSEVELTPLFNEKSVSHIVILVHDITDKKLAEIEIEASREKLSESKLRYQSLFQYNIDTVFSLNLKGEILNANLAITELTGFSPKEVVGLTPKDFVVNEDIDKIVYNFKKAVEGTATSINITGVDRLRNRLELIVKFIPIKIQSKITGVYGILRDITEEKDLIEKLMESERHFRIISENSEDLISLISRRGKIDYLSPSSKRILGFKNEDMLGLSYTDFVHPDDLPECNKLLEESVSKQTYSKVLYRMKNKNGDWIWLEMAATPVLDEIDNLVHIVAISRDMTVRLEYEERLKYLASHDFLTRLENRRSFKVRLRRALSRFNKDKMGLALFMIDIDHFKTINDQYGHDKGDYVLTEFAKRLKKVIGNSGVKFRFGGDEFAVILEQTTKEEVVELINMFQEELKKSWHANSVEVEITTSIGVAFIDGSLKSKISDRSLIKTADDALYEAKNAGRNCYKLNELS